MRSKFITIIFCLLACFSGAEIFAQTDSAIISGSGVRVSGSSAKTGKDTGTVKYNPNKAIRRSLMLPGWGQITNRKIWKAPLVWAALGITGGIFIYNIRQYRDSRDAYILASDTIPGNDFLIKQPYFSVKDQPERIKAFRDQTRQNVDYSALVFLIFWGLNVADAAVDAHLKTFDVSDDLSIQIKPGYSPIANTNGVSIVLHIGK